MSYRERWMIFFVISIYHSCPEKVTMVPIPGKLCIYFREESWGSWDISDGEVYLCVAQSIKGDVMLNPIEKFKRSILHLNRSLHHWHIQQHATIAQLATIQKRCRSNHLLKITQYMFMYVCICIDLIERGNEMAKMAKNLSRVVYLQLGSL